MASKFQKATSILNRVIFHLALQFQHFSYDFKFDMCHDFSFWEAETERCIPKKMIEDETPYYYAFPPLCERKEFDCMDA